MEHTTNMNEEWEGVKPSHYSYIYFFCFGTLKVAAGVEDELLEVFGPR